jgi:hypothetical protein
MKSCRFHWSAGRMIEWGTTSLHLVQVVQCGVGIDELWI